MNTSSAAAPGRRATAAAPRRRDRRSAPPAAAYVALPLGPLEMSALVSAAATAAAAAAAALGLFGAADPAERPGRGGGERQPRVCRACRGAGTIDCLCARWDFNAARAAGRAPPPTCATCRGAGRTTCPECRGAGTRGGPGGGPGVLGLEPILARVSDWTNGAGTRPSPFAPHPHSPFQRHHPTHAPPRAAFIAGLLPEPTAPHFNNNNSPTPDFG